MKNVLRFVGSLVLIFCLAGITPAQNSAPKKEPVVVKTTKKVGHGLKVAGKYTLGGFLRLFFDSSGRPYGG